MKALSIRQPYAWLIVNGHKDVENRTWHTPYRGPVLIHAGKTYPKRDHADDFETWGERGYPADRESMLGGIVGIATITGCVTSSASRWWIGPVGFTLADVLPLPALIPCKGELGFFDVPAEVAMQLPQHIRERMLGGAPPQESPWQVKVQCSRGERTLRAGLRWCDSLHRGTWEIVEPVGGRIYSPSGFGGTPTFWCRPVGDVPPGAVAWLDHARDDGCISFCGDSIAAGLVDAAGVFVPHGSNTTQVAPQEPANLSDNAPGVRVPRTGATIDEANTALAVARTREEKLAACELLAAAAQAEVSRLRAAGVGGSAK